MLEKERTFFIIPPGSENVNEMKSIFAQKSRHNRHCEERSDAAISFVKTAILRSLSRVIKPRLLRFARNDKRGACASHEIFLNDCGAESGRRCAAAYGSEEEQVVEDLRCWNKRCFTEKRSVAGNRRLADRRLVMDCDTHRTFRMVFFVVVM
jgi:hypothetical protein